MSDALKHPPLLMNGGWRPVEAFQLGELTIKVPVRNPAPVYNTIRVIDLDRLKSTYKRRRKRETNGADTLISLDRVVAIIDALLTQPGGNLPTVVVVEQSVKGEIKTNYAITGDIIFLGDHLSTSWVEGAETDLVFETLSNALSNYMSQRLPEYKLTSI